MKDQGEMIHFMGITGLNPFFFEIFTDYIKNDVKCEYYERDD